MNRDLSVPFNLCATEIEASLFYVMLSVDDVENITARDAEYAETAQRVELSGDSRFTIH